MHVLRTLGCIELGREPKWNGENGDDSGEQQRGGDAEHKDL